jgi:hypothetical protein
MRFVNIRVIPRANKNLIKKEQDRLKVYLTAPAIQDRANKALIEMLSGYLGIKKAQISIVKGHKTRDKLIQII